MTTAEMTTEFEGLHPLQFTSRWRDLLNEPGDDFYLYRTPSGSYSWFRYDFRVVPPMWPRGARAVINVIRMPDGADPAEVRRWLEDNGELLRDWAMERVGTMDVQDRLWCALRVRHFIDDGQAVEEDLNAWNDAGRPDSFVRFLVCHRGATVEWCDHLGEYFIRWCEREPGRTSHMWVPLMTARWMGRRR